MNLFDDVGSHLTGLEQLRALQAGGRRSPFADLLDMRLVEVDAGRVVIESTASNATLNTHGTAHGGFIASLLDSACGLATVSKLGANQHSTTLELKISYHRAITSDAGVIRAEGVVVSIGRRVAFAEARLRDASGRLAATATSTLPVMERTQGRVG